MSSRHQLLTFARVIHSHGFEARLSPAGELQGLMTGTDAAGQPFEEWSTIEPSWAGVRRWLGY